MRRLNRTCSGSVLTIHERGPGLVAVHAVLLEYYSVVKKPRHSVRHIIYVCDVIELTTAQGGAHGHPLLAQLVGKCVDGDGKRSCSCVACGPSKGNAALDRVLGHATKCAALKKDEKELWVAAKQASGKASIGAQLEKVNDEAMERPSHVCSPRLQLNRRHLRLIVTLLGCSISCRTAQQFPKLSKQSPQLYTPWTTPRTRRLIWTPSLLIGSEKNTFL